jgi:hypothetical protein
MAQPSPKEDLDWQLRALQTALTAQYQYYSPALVVIFGLFIFLTGLVYSPSLRYAFQGAEWVYSYIMAIFVAVGVFLVALWLYWMRRYRKFSRTIASLLLNRTALSVEDYQNIINILS